MCSDPVTLGGGITIAKGGALESGSGVKYPAATQLSYRRVSTSPGTYWGGSCLLAVLLTSGESRRVRGPPGRRARRRRPGDPRRAATGTGTARRRLADKPAEAGAASSWRVKTGE